MRAATGIATSSEYLAGRVSSGTWIRNILSHFSFYRTDPSVAPDVTSPSRFDHVRLEHLTSSHPGDMPTDATIV